MVWFDERSTHRFYANCFRSNEYQAQRTPECSVFQCMSIKSQTDIQLPYCSTVTYGTLANKKQQEHCSLSRFHSLFPSLRVSAKKEVKETRAGERMADTVAMHTDDSHLCVRAFVCECVRNKLI